MRQPGNVMASTNLLHTQPEALLLRVSGRHQCRQNRLVGEEQLVRRGFAVASIIGHHFVVSVPSHPAVVLPSPTRLHCSSRVEPDSSRLWTSLGSRAFSLSAEDQSLLLHLYYRHVLLY